MTGVRDRRIGLRASCATLPSARGTATVGSSPRVSASSKACAMLWARPHFGPDGRNNLHHKGCGREISERMRGEDQLQLR